MPTIAENSAAPPSGSISHPARTIRLADGRRLAFDELGDPSGRPLLYFHGFMSSRLEARYADSMARERGIRLIPVDRPGIGLSDFQTNRTLLDWPRDVSELADTLGLGRFAVLGVSGGGPHAHACAASIPERLTAVGVACGLGPTREPGALRGMPALNRFGLTVARRRYWPGLWVFTAATPLIRHSPERLLVALARIGAGADGTVLAEPRLRTLLIGSVRESIRAGARGAARELAIFAAPWPFRPEDIRIPVRLWHGESDPIVPTAMTRRLERRIPDCRASYHAGDGHFSLLVRQGPDILDALVP